MAALVLLAAYATGIAMVCIITPWGITGYSLGIGILLLLWGMLYRSTWSWLPILLLVMLAGFIHASQQLKPPADSNHISRFASNTPLILEATVLTIEDRSTGGYRLLADMHQVIQAHTAAAVTGKTLLYIKEGELTAKPGQIVRWRARLRQPSRFGNPGEFDYPLYLATHDIYVTSFVVHAEDLVVIMNHPEQQTKVLGNLRHELSQHIKEVVPENAVGFMQSLLLGMKGGISDKQRQLLAGSGVAHLFAISGLHFGLLALLLYQVGKWFYTRSCRLILWCPPQRILPVLLIIPLAAYLFLTGNAWATQRAFLMISAVALLLARDHRTPPHVLLATVAFLLLLVNPLALFQPGFQLSFAGVAGILAWMPRWQHWSARLPKWSHWPLALALTTAAATLATAPATLWHFHQFAPAGLLTNLIAIPFIAWGAVPLGLASLAILPVWSALADWGLLFSARLVTVTIEIVSAISRWPGLKSISFYLTASNLILLSGAIILLLPFGKERRHNLCRLMLLLLVLTGAWFTRPFVDDFQVTALSVGQGDATLVSLADDVHFLVDGGGLPGSNIDPGEQLIAPALGRLNIKRLQGVVLTHNHPDHSSGLTYILRRFPVENFYFAGDMGSLEPDLLAVLQERNITMQPVDDGDWTLVHKNAKQTLRLFAPSQKAKDINERSLAVFAGNRENGVLLTADLGRRGLDQLISAGLPGRASLLKLPHHGSRHACPEKYLEWTQPTVAFVSAGRNNTYGFPHQPTIQSCVTQGVPLFRTDLAGMLIFRLADNQWRAYEHGAL